MKSYKKSKFNFPRPESSSRISRGYQDEVSFMENSGRRSRIPIMPKRSNSLDAKSSHKRSSNRQLGCSSMIPRLDRKINKKPRTADRESFKHKTEMLLMEKDDLEENQKIEVIEAAEEEDDADEKPTVEQSRMDDDILECKINENFVEFKNNVLRIPEFWSDASNTVTSILKNTANVISKEYPSADVESFESEIKNILNETKIVKQQIFTKTENIITQANRVYHHQDRFETQPSEAELEAIVKKMSEARKNVFTRKSVFGEVLKSCSEVKEVREVEKGMKIKPKSATRNYREEKREPEMRRPKSRAQTLEKKRQFDDNVMQSCGDWQFKTTLPVIISGEPRLKTDDKTTQTVNLWTVELYRREEALCVLNNQILELHRLCEDHISKFKNFNLQIKLRGMTGKAQTTTSTPKEIQLLLDEKLQLAEKNSKLLFYNKDLQTVLKQKEMDIHQKDRLISQQKKLLLVRDELIEMLKSKCKIEEVEQL